VSDTLAPAAPGAVTTTTSWWRFEWPLIVAVIALGSAGFAAGAGQVDGAGFPANRSAM